MSVQINIENNTTGQSNTTEHMHNYDSSEIESLISTSFNLTEEVNNALKNYPHELNSGNLVSQEDEDEYKESDYLEVFKVVLEDIKEDIEEFFDENYCPFGDDELLYDCINYNFTDSDIQKFDFIISKYYSLIHKITQKLINIG